MAKFINIGTIMRKKDKPDQYYLKLEQSKTKDGDYYGEKLFPIKLANGTVLEEGDFLSVFSKKKKLLAADRPDLAKFLLFDLCVRLEDENEEEDEEETPKKKVVKKKPSKPVVEEDEEEDLDDEEDEEEEPPRKKAKKKIVEDDDEIPF